MSWKFIETPFRQKHRFSRRQVFAFGAAGSAVFAVFGVVGHLSSGYTYPFRYWSSSAEELAMIEATLPSRTSYLYLRFETLLGRDFDAHDPRPKILLVGDSYAEDLTNALYESGLLRNLQVSTRHIPRDCGNLFMPEAQLATLMDATQVEGCKGKHIYEDAALRARMADADEIWFASAWVQWQAGHVADSVLAVQEFSHRPVRVFGRKHLGDVHVHQLLSLPPAQRFAVRDAIPAWAIAVDETMRRSVPPDVFIDVQQLLCGSDTHTCSPFTPNHHLITFDGTHLTPEGARIYGHELIASTPLRRFATSLSPMAAVSVPN